MRHSFSIDDSALFPISRLKPLVGMMHHRSPVEHGQIWDGGGGGAIGAMVGAQVGVAGGGGDDYAGRGGRDRVGRERRI